jgi:hypothetical protein
MERESISITTPVGKKKIVIKSWLTGREKRLIQSVFIDDTEFQGGEYKISGKKLTEAQDKTIETMVISVDGDSNKVLEKILDMNSEDFDFILVEINKISSPTTEQIKK